MTCKRAAELLLDYHDGTLDVDMRDEIEAHLAQCATCRALVATYKTTTSLCHKLLGATVPSEVEERLLSFLRSHLPGKTHAPKAGKH